jgi:hypothetical protein
MSAIADDLAALRSDLLDLRDEIKTLRSHATTAPIACRRAEDLSMAMVQRLDRVASAAPERATATGDALPLWLHITCGGTFASHSVPKLTVCRKCDHLTGEADWKPLYILGDES